MNKITIWGPPLVLLIIGAAAYITVVKLTTPKTITIQAQPQVTEQIQSTDSAQASSSAETAISTSVTVPSDAEVTLWQKAADEGSEVWRLDVTSAAKRLAQQYGFTTADEFRLDSTSHQATSLVTAKHGNTTYQITMYQPKIIGEKGVWTIQNISL